jgi:YfiH family protein
VLERRVLGPGLVAWVAPTLESEGFLAAFTERSGGVSRGPFWSLNLGFATGDRRDLVAENRRRLRDALGVGPFTVARQVHGAAVVTVGPEGAGAGFDGPTGALVGDVLATRSPRVAVAVLVADCVPVALAEPRTGRLAAVHAGWRGLAAGVVDAAVAAFERPREVVAAIGPCVGPDHYEVGPEVVAAVRAGTDGCAVAIRTSGRPRLDLGATIERRLRRLGVTRLVRTELCTACRPDRFFSHRRDGRTGRQALVAVRLR